MNCRSSFYRSDSGVSLLLHPDNMLFRSSAPPAMTFRSAGNSVVSIMVASGSELLCWASKISTTQGPEKEMKNVYEEISGLETGCNCRWRRASSCWKLQFRILSMATQASMHLPSLPEERIVLGGGSIVVDYLVAVASYLEPDLLHSSKSGFLDWPISHMIAMDAAKGLACLHRDYVPPIFHRDVNSSNILLDEDFGARIADFGVAEAVDSNGKSINSMSAIARSCGYIAPAP